MIELLLSKLRAWFQRDPRMARHAQHEWIRQQSQLHPVEKGDHWR
jgi:hypothetical protein